MKVQNCSWIKFGRKKILHFGEAIVHNTSAFQLALIFGINLQCSRCRFIIIYSNVERFLGRAYVRVNGFVRGEAKSNRPRMTVTNEGFYQDDRMEPEPGIPSEYHKPVRQTPQPQFFCNPIRRLKCS